jgi:hypothetical protein
MTLTSVKTCPNCTTDLETEFNYCPGCGQDAHVHRFNLAHIVHEVIHALTHADKGVLQLIAALTVRPGTVAREYVLEGKRKRYFNPFTFLVITVGFVVLSNSIFHPYVRDSSSDNVASTHQHSTKGAQPTKRTQFEERRQTMMQFIEKRGNILIFLAVPLFALVYWLFFLRTGINFAEHLVAHVFFMGFYALATALIFVPSRHYIPSGSWYNYTLLMLQFFYLTFAYTAFIPSRTSFKLLKAATAAFLAILSWFIVSGGIGTLYIIFG